MMTPAPFLIGFLFGGIYEVVKLFRLRFGHQAPPARELLWSFVIGIPSFLAFSFASGVVIVWGADQKTNHTIEFFLIIVNWCVTLFGEWIIEKACYPQERATWNDNIRLRTLLISLIYLFLFALGVAPYIKYATETGITFLRGLSTLGLSSMAGLIFAFVWTTVYFIHRREEDYARSVIRGILCSFMARQAPKFYADSLIEQMLEINDAEQIVACWKLAHRHRTEVANFSIERDGRLHPGLESLRVPRHKLGDIASDAKREQAKLCDVVLRVSDMLIESDLKAGEAAEWLREHVATLGLGEANQILAVLKERRESFKKNT